MTRFSRRLRGFTLIELILVLSVGSMITLLSFQGMKRTTESNQAAIVGQQMRIVGTAVNNYISTRYTPISQLANAAGTASDPGPRTCAGATCTITVQTLVNEGLLPGNYANRNSFASPYTIVLTVSGTTPNWLVNGLVTTANPWTVGGVTRYDLLGQAMVAAGPDSGMTRSLATRIDGYNGIWNEPSSTYSNISQLGQLGFRAGYGSSLYSAYLRRDGTLPMTGDLNMSDGTPHNIANASNISGNGRLTMNQVYSSYVNLAGNLDMTGTATINGSANVNGNTNVSGTLSANHVTLPVGNSLQIGGVYYYGDGSNSAIRQNGGLYIQNLAGTAPADLASVNNINASGNASVNGGVYTNYLQSNGAGYIGNGLTVVNSQNIASGNLNIAGGSITLADGAQINTAGTGYYETAGNLYLKPWNGNGITIVGGGGGSGQLVTTGRLTSNEYIQPNGYAAQGGGCAPNGLIGNSGAGPLFCTNGVWKSAGSLSTIAVSSGGWQSQAVASCPGGYTLTGGSCDMNRGGDGREISARSCQPSGNGYYCNEGNGGTCIAYAICGQ